MRILIVLSFFILFAGSFSFTACKSGPATFCDTTCTTDTFRFSIEHPDKPFVTIGVKNCMPDTITWSNDRMDAKRKFIFSNLMGAEIHLNKNYIRSFIKDTSYAWLVFNDCINGQGYIVKIPFNKTSNIFRKNSAFNSFDPKFSVADNLVAYTDKGNVFTEDMATGKKASMTFGQQIDIDYKNIHDKVDSITVTPDKIRARVKIDNEWKIIEKKISLE
jgi:hypothetical protein